MSTLASSVIDGETELHDEETTPEDDPHGYWGMEAPYGRFKNGKPRKTPGGKPGGGNVGGRSLQSLRDPLAERIVEYLGAPLGMISPLGLAVLDERSERTADAMIALATRRPRVRKMIERFVEGSSAVDLGSTVVGIGVAIQVDRGVVDPEGKASRYFNIDKLSQEVYGGYPERVVREPEPHGILGEMQ